MPLSSHEQMAAAAELLEAAAAARVLRQEQPNNLESDPQQAVKMPQWKQHKQPCLAGVVAQPISQHYMEMMQWQQQQLPTGKAELSNMQVGGRGRSW